MREKDFQNDLVGRAATNGWNHIPGPTLENSGERDTNEAILESRFRRALHALNPSATPAAVDHVVEEVKSVITSAADDLLAANEKMHEYLTEGVTYTNDEGDSSVVRLIDFSNPEANEFVVSDEVSFKISSSANYTGDRAHRRMDVVYWVNGLPLVVSELKRADRKDWHSAALELKNTYWEECPEFFASNLLCYASGGHKMAYGSVLSDIDQWKTWDATFSQPVVKGAYHDTVRRIGLLTDPANIITILRGFVLFINKNGKNKFKALPRYAQVEASGKICGRISSAGPDRSGLIVHHQGTGKTMLMAYVAKAIRRDQLFTEAPTIVAVVDRTALFNNVRAEFSAAGIDNLRLIQSRKDLVDALKSDDHRGVVVTTIHKFHEATENGKALTNRSNVVVLIDECHRTQEGNLGKQMRSALPNAYFFGMTGTPVQSNTHNTFSMFSGNNDPNGILHHYSQERAIRDGVSLPVFVESRPVSHEISEELDRWVEEEATKLEISSVEKKKAIEEASKIEVLLSNKKHIDTVAAEIVDHFSLRPKGEKAMVVAVNRISCVRYYDALVEKISGVSLSEEAEGNTTEEENRRLADARSQVEVVISEDTKEDGPELRAHYKDRATTAAVEVAMADPHSPVKYLVVTSKLLTGFDAPPVCVMYLDKPLKAHTLFQSVTRTNRTWKNPITDVVKTHGLVVDYIGLGQALLDAMRDEEWHDTRRQPVDLSEVYSEFLRIMGVWKEELLSGVDFSDDDWFIEVVAGMTDEQELDFTTEFRRAIGYLDAISNFYKGSKGIEEVMEVYLKLELIYESFVDESEDHFSGVFAKRLQEMLAGDAVSDVEIEDGKQVIKTTEAMLRQINAALVDGEEPLDPKSATPEDVLERIKRRIDRGSKGTESGWDSLRLRLIELNASVLASAKEGREYMRLLLELLTDVLQQEQDDEEMSHVSILGCPVNRLETYIRSRFKADTPHQVGELAKTIDAEVRAVLRAEAGDFEWQEVEEVKRVVSKNVRSTVRRLFGKEAAFGEGSLFDSVMGYIEKNYSNGEDRDCCDENGNCTGLGVPKGKGPKSPLDGAAATDCL